MKTPHLLLLPLLATGCAAAQPFEGPGWDREAGLTATLDGPVVVAATYAHIARGEKGAFNDHVDQIVEALEDAPEGLIGYALRGEILGDEVWTVSAWTDEDALLGFVTGEAHAAAMADAGTVLEAAAFARWTVAPEDLEIDWKGDILPRLEEAAAEGSTY